MIRFVPVILVKPDLPWNPASWGTADSGKVLLPNIAGTRRIRPFRIIWSDIFRQCWSGRFSENLATRLYKKTKRIIGIHQKLTDWIWSPCDIGIITRPTRSDWSIMTWVTIELIIKKHVPISINPTLILRLGVDDAGFGFLDLDNLFQTSIWIGIGVEMKRLI